MSCDCSFSDEETRVCNVYQLKCFRLLNNSCLLAQIFAVCPGGIHNRIRSSHASVKRGNSCSQASTDLRGLFVLCDHVMLLDVDHYFSRRKRLCFSFGLFVCQIAEKVVNEF